MMVYLPKEVCMQLFAGFDAAYYDSCAPHHHDKQRAKSKTEVDSHVKGSIGWRHAL